MLKNNIKAQSLDTQCVMSKMCRIRYIKKKQQKNKSTSGVQSPNTCGFLWGRAKQWSCPSSGDEWREGETGEEERGGEGQSRSSSTIVGVLLQEQIRPRCHDASSINMKADREATGTITSRIHHLGHPISAERQREEPCSSITPFRSTISPGCELLMLADDQSRPRLNG